MSNWLELPRVKAPAPDDRTKSVAYAISKDFVGRTAQVRKRTPIFQLWAHVVGQLPPINNIAKLQSRNLTPTISTLMDAVACFKGVNRPYVDDRTGASVLVYVLTPKVSIEYEPSMVCVARAVRVPSETVLTVQVRPSEALQELGLELNGMVTRLEFVSSSAESPLFPANHKSRYQQLLWSDTQ